MPEKLVHPVSVRLSDRQKNHVDAYVQWCIEQMPGASVSDADAVRQLLERGYRAWQAEKAPRRKRGGVG